MANCYAAGLIKAHRVVGYSEDGFAIMGQGTYIFKPTIEMGTMKTKKTNLYPQICRILQIYEESESE